MKKIIIVFIKVLQSLFIAAAAAFILMYLAGLRFYVVVTGSMSPTIEVGSLCVVNSRATYDSVSAGDIISFRAGSEMLVTHRAVRIEKDGIVTKGDANKSEDIAKVTKETFAGRNLISVPKLGRAVTFLRSKAGIAAAAAVFVLLLAAETLLRKEPET